MLQEARIPYERSPSGWTVRVGEEQFPTSVGQYVMGGEGQFPSQSF
jgi:hypothetical protein